VWISFPKLAEAKSAGDKHLGLTDPQQARQDSVPVRSSLVSLFTPKDRYNLWTSHCHATSAYGSQGTGTILTF